MKARLASALCFCVASLAVGRSYGQAPAAPKPPSIGAQMVKIVLTQFAINAHASDSNTHKPLQAGGSWSLSKTRPASCPQTSEDCAEVIYSVPDQSVRCTWTVLLDPDGKHGKVLDENDQAETYMVRNLTPGEAAPLIQSRSKPVIPPIAAAIRGSGTVILVVLVGKSGAEEKVVVQSGPPMLQQASIDAAKKWTFLPLKIGARPVSYQVPLIFTFLEPFASIPGAIEVAP